MAFKHRQPGMPSSRSVSLSDRGLLRSSNQDQVCANDELKLWLVADGMGGHAGGGQASRLACQAILDGIEAGASLPEAITGAHHSIRRSQRENPELAGMGTTVAAVRELNHHLDVCWVGDSRVYRFDRSSGRLERLTRDHTLAQMLVDSGELEPEDAAVHPQRHVLTNCLGQPVGEPTIGRASLDWGGDDWLLVCSDGLTGELNEAVLTELLGRGPDPEAAAQILLESALAAGGRDNISLVIVTSPA